MVIYTREEKVLIIPEGEGCGCQGGGQPTQRCEREKREAYESGVTEGMAEQKALLSSTAITSNGTYTTENGWNEVEVNVPQFMPTEEKTLSLVQNVPGPWVVLADGPIGMSKVTVEDNGYGSWKYDQGYAAGSLMDVELYFTTRSTEEIEGHTKITFGLHNGRDLTIDGDSYNSTFEVLFPPQFQVAPYSFNTKVDIHNVMTVSSVTFTVDCNGQENWIIPSIQSFSINGHQVSNMSFSYVETTPSSGSFIKAAIYTITFDEIHI